MRRLIDGADVVAPGEQRQIADPQAWLNGYFAEGEHPVRGHINVVGNRIQLAERPPSRALSGRPSTGSRNKMRQLEGPGIAGSRQCGHGPAVPGRVFETGQDLVGGNTGAPSDTTVL